MKAAPVRIAVVALVLLFGAFVAPALVSCTQGPPPTPDKPELRTGHILWNGLERTFATYAPADLAKPAPVVFFLHGGSSSASAIWNGDGGRSWKALADEHGFLLVLPEGRADPADPDQHHWNDCRTGVTNPDAISAEDDVGFIDRLIDLAAERVAIDPLRIYVTGASNGGMMTYRLAMQLGDRLAAVGAIVANLPDPSECAFVATAIPILIMNGTADPVIPYNGGCVAGGACDRGSVRSTDATVAFWVHTNGATTVPNEVSLPDAVPSDHSTITKFTYDGGATGEDVVFYRVDGGGHSAPGSDPIPASVERVAGPKNHDIDAPTEVWRFFGEHARATP
jgi:polyhydroxybutyrate depolymerase